jgi:hypothetical protein
MKKQEMLGQLRLFLADPIGKIWDDELLNDILNDALKQYCIDTGCLTGRFDFYPDKDGQYNYPDNFASFISGWNKAGKQILPTTAAELFSRQHRKEQLAGDAQYIYDDQKQYGQFELYPCPTQQVSDVTIDGNFGEISDSEYGVFLNEDYGTTISMISFDYAGEIFYNRIGDFEEIKDYFGVICYALYLAYNTDMDMGNADNAAIWKARYLSRLSGYYAIKQNNTGITRTSNFY